MDTSFSSDNYLATSPVSGVFSSLRQLVANRFSTNVHLVSKCGKKVQRKSDHWLTHHKFFQETGILENNVHFCRQRYEKAGICKELEITHFIDDRLEVLSYLIDLVPNLFLFSPREEEVKQFHKFLSRVQVISSWQELESALLIYPTEY